MKAAVSTHFHTVLIGICVLLGTTILPAQAQTDTTEEDQALPDIAPQEVEIRGTLDISFPSLERQPLIGFNPPPSTYEVPDDRTPYIEEYKQAAADLPNSSLQRPEPPQAVGRFGSVHAGMLKLGAGRFFQRTLYGTLNYSVKPQLEIDLETDYSGSQGHTPHEITGFSSRYDSFDGQLGLTSSRSSFQLYGTLGGFYDSYVMYGAAPPENVSQNPADVQNLAQPNRYGSGATVSAGIESHGILPSRLELTYGAARYETKNELEDATETFGLQRENRAALDAALNHGFGSFMLSLDGTAGVGGLDDNSVFDHDYFSYDTGLQGRWEAGNQLDLRLGARLLGYETSVQNGGDKLAYISPMAQATFRPSNSLHLYVQNTPSIQMHGTAGMFEMNPYLTSTVTVQPTIATIDAEGGARIYRGATQFAVWGGVREYPTYQYFHDARSNPGAFARGFFEAGYEEARIIHAGARVSLQLPQSLQASLNISLQQARLTDENIVIPYVPSVRSGVSLAYPFAQNKGLFQVDGTVYGSRYVDLANEERVGAYVDFDAEASYDIVDAFGLYARLSNIRVGALEEWNHYPRPSYIAEGGLRVLW